MSAPQSSSAAPPPLVVTLPMLWRRRGYFVVSVLLSLALGVAYLLVTRPTYQVAARLLVEERARPLDQARHAGEAKDFLPTQAEIIRSPAVIGRVVESLQLPPPAPGESPVVTILEGLQVDPLVGTNVLSLRYQGTDPELAIETTNAIISSYKAYLKSSEQDTYGETIKLLTEREQELHDKISELQQKYVEFRKKSPLMGETNGTGQVDRSMLTALGQNLTLAKSRRVQLEHHLQQMIAFRDANIARDEAIRLTPTSLHRGGGAVPVEHDAVSVACGCAKCSESDPASFSRATGDWQAAADVLSKLSRDGLVSIEDTTPLQLSLQEARAREAELSQKLGIKHPELLGVRHLIATLETRLRKSVDEAPALMQRELESLEREVTSLAGLYDVEFEKVKAAELFLLQDRAVMDEIHRLKSAHDTVLANLNESQLAHQALAGGRASVSVRILDAPQVVSDLAWPQPGPLLGLCFLLGLAGGLALVLAVENLDRLLAAARRPATAPA